MKTIVLVDDHRDTRDVFRLCLEREGYRVFEAENGEDGVQLAFEHRPELVLMDLSLPGLDGLEAARILKTDAALGGTQMIAITARAMGDDRQRAHEIGFDSYLTKPCSPPMLVAEVERLIGPALDLDADAAADGNGRRR